MALVIEDGTIVAGANSFATLAEMRNYASARGVTLSSIDSEVEVLAIKAMDYLQSIRGQFLGAEISADQELPFPRNPIYQNGFIVSPSEIPSMIKEVQMVLVIDAHNGVDLLPTSTGGNNIKKTKVGPLEKEFFGNNASTTRPALRRAEDLLSQFLSAGFSGGFASIRV